MLQANRQLQEFKDKGTLAKKLFFKGKQANRELQQFDRTLGVGGGGGGGGGKGGVRNWKTGQEERSESGAIVHTKRCSELRKMGVAKGH